MNHPLRRQVQRIARHARLLLLVRGAAWFLAIALFAVLVVGGLDYVLRTRDAGLRTLASGAIVALLGWSFWRYLLPVLRYRSDEVTIARWIERGRPDLNDELSSAIAFLAASPNDNTAGSMQLRMEHVQRVSNRIAERPLSKSLRLSYSTWPLLLFAMVSLLFVAACWADPAAAQLAALRLVAPWNDLRWPRRNQIVLLNPVTRLAVGQDFEALVTDKNGELPTDVTIHYWYEGTDSDSIEKVPMTYAGGRMFHRLANVTRPFRYRVTGGDDDTMGWLTLSLVQPPEIQSVIARIHPPSYTGWQPYDAAGPFQALKDSRVELSATFSEAVAQVTLRADPRVIADQASAALVCSLAEGGQQAHLSDDHAWLVGESGRYWLDIVARNDLRVSSRAWDVQALVDQPPAVTLAHGATGAVVGSKAKLPVTAIAQDDIALKSVEVQLRAAAAEPLVELPLWSGPETIPASSLSALSGDDERRETGMIDLGSLSIEAGQTIELIAIARDYKPQEGRSTPLSLHVINDAELEDRIAQLQSRLLATVDQAVRQQRDVSGQTRSLDLQFEERTQAQPRDADALKGIGLHQRQTAEMLTSTPESVLAQAQGILSEIQINQMTVPGIEQQISSVINTLQGWTRNELPAVERAILAATKELASTLEAGGAITPDVRTAVHDATVVQDDLLNQLEQLAAQLAEWEGFRRFAGEVRQLIRDQQRLLGDTTAMRSETLGIELRQLNPEQRAQLKGLAQQQMNYVRRMDDITSRMSSAADEAQAQDLQVAKTLRSALDIIERHSIAVGMRESAQNAEANKLSESTARQQHVIEGLNELLIALTGRTSTDAQSAQNPASAAAAELSQVQREQDDIDRKRHQLAMNENSAANPEERQDLAEQQRRLAKRVLDLAKQLARSRSPAADPANRAARAMSDSADAIQSGDFDQAQQQADAARQALEEAAAALAKQAYAQQQQELNQLKSELLQQLEQLRAAQLAIQEKTADMENQRSAQSLLSPEQQKIVHSLGGEQQDIAVRIKQLAERAVSWKLFEHLLEQAAADLEEVSARLLQADTSPETQRLQSRALARIEQMLTALQRESNPQSQQSESNAQNQQPTNPQPPRNDQRPISIEELELLQIMQSDLAAQTEELEKQRETEHDTQPWRREQERLAQEQGRLQELLLEMFSAGE